MKSNKPEKKKSNKIVYIAAAVVLFLIIAGVVAKKNGWITNNKLKKIAVEKAQRRTIVETVTASGKIQPLTEVKLSSEVSGEVIVLNVKEGDSVKAGQLLAVINPAIYESQVLQADASLNQIRASRAGTKASLIQAKSAFDQAKANYNRSKTLHSQKVISDSELEASKLSLDQAEATYLTTEEQARGAGFNVASAEAQVKQSRDNLLKTKIYAPMSGIVSLVNVKLGERVVGTAQMSGTEIIRIADLVNMQAQVDVNENDVLRVSIGDTAEVEVDAYLGKKFKAVVSQIAYSSSSSLSLGSQATNFVVKLELLKNSYSDLIKPELSKRYPFRPGMSCTVDIKTEEKVNILTVPIMSVTTREDLSTKPKAAKVEDATEEPAKKEVEEMVFISNGTKVQTVQVKTGIQDASYIEILSGLKEGDNVVKAPFKAISKTLKNDDLIKEVTEKELFKEEDKDGE